MASYPRGVVKPPNEEGPKGNRVNSSGSLSRSHGNVKAPNVQSAAGAKVNSCGPMGKSHGDVKGSNERNKFDVANAHAGYTEPVAEPGKGAVPTQPFQKSGLPSPMSIPLRDSTKK